MRAGLTTPATSPLRRWILAVLLALPVLLATAVAPPPAAATPWGSSGADWNGILCQAGGTQLPLGAWTVNGTTQAFALADVAGDGTSFGPAPVSGTVTPMTPGQAGYDESTIAAVAYLLGTHGDGSAAELAEISADVASLAGASGQTTCLGQGGTSAQRAASRVAEARRFAGPYTVTVEPPRGRPGAATQVPVTVRTAAGVAVPGLEVSVVAGGAPATAVTGADGIARPTITVPTVAAVTVTATVSAPTGLYYIASTPPSIALGPATAATGTAVLRPVLHPDPAVSIDSGELLLDGGTLAPTARVTGTYGYRGTGSLSVVGPAQSVNGSCRDVPAASYGDAAWTGRFTFAGDGTYGAGASDALDPGCYAVRASVETTDSAPHETAAASPRSLLVSSLTLRSAASARVSAAGDLQATVTGDDSDSTIPVSVVTTVVARGPVAFGSGGGAGKDGCDGIDPAAWAKAPTAGTSAPVTASRSGSGLTAKAGLPDVKAVGCYSLVASSEVSVDGRTVKAAGDPGADGTVTAVLRPSLVVAASALSGRQGKAMTGTIQVTGTFGFPASLRVGLVSGETLPITGCRDARFPTDAAATVPTGDTTRVGTSGDRGYTFATPAAEHNACYAVTAQLVMDDNHAVTASGGDPDESTIFLAGVDPQPRLDTSSSGVGGGDAERIAVVYLVALLVMLLASLVVAIRAWRADRRDAGPIRSLALLD